MIQATVVVSIVSYLCNGRYARVKTKDSAGKKALFVKVIAENTVLVIGLQLPLPDKVREALNVADGIRGFCSDFGE